MPVSIVSVHHMAPRSWKYFGISHQGLKKELNIANRASAHLETISVTIYLFMLKKVVISAITPDSSVVARVVVVVVVVVVVAVVTTAVPSAKQ